MRTELTRRTMLKTLSKTLAFSTLTAAPLSLVSCRKEDPPKPAPTPGTKASLKARSGAPCVPGSDFNIVLHGLFFIEVWDDKDRGGQDIPEEKKIHILTPDCSQLPIRHVYRAGSSSTGTFVDLSGSADYYSRFKSGQSKPSLPLPQMKGFAGLLDTTQQFFSFYLPYPNRITPLRVIPANQVTSSATIIPADFPLVVALTYGNARPTRPPLPVPQTSWDPNSNFHIFAEPECKMTCDEMVAHAKDTLKAAKAMFKDPNAFDVDLVGRIDCTHPPDPLEIPRDDCPPDVGGAGLGALGVSSDEEKSLSELPNAPDCSHGDKRIAPAVHMPTCASVILTP